MHSNEILMRGRHFNVEWKQDRKVYIFNLNFVIYTHTGKTFSWNSCSRGSFWPRDRTHISFISCIAGGFFTTAPPGKPQILLTVVISEGMFYVLSYFLLYSLGVFPTFMLLFTNYFYKENKWSCERHPCPQINMGLYSSKDSSLALESGGRSTSILCSDPKVMSVSQFSFLYLHPWAVYNVDGWRWIFYLTLLCCVGCKMPSLHPFKLAGITYLASMKVFSPVRSPCDGNACVGLMDGGQIKQILILSHSRHATQESPENKELLSPAPWTQPELKKCGQMAESKSTQKHTGHLYGCCFLACLSNLTGTCLQRIIVR